MQKVGLSFDFNEFDDEEEDDVDDLSDNLSSHEKYTEHDVGTYAVVRLEVGKFPEIVICLEIAGKLKDPISKLLVTL